MSIITVRKEIEVETEVDVDVEIDLEDIEDSDLMAECMERFSPQELAMALDIKADSWEFTEKMRDYFVSEMARVE
jgi:fibrillarin-like rRNA methylase